MWFRTTFFLCCLFLELVCLVVILTVALAYWNKNAYMKTDIEVTSFKYFKLTTTSSVEITSIHMPDLANLIYFKGGCDYSPYWQNFGYCDDGSNVQTCDYDNGDCCLPLIRQEFCSNCKCHIDGKRHAALPTAQDFECKNELKFDRICQDVVNFYACGFDLEDCCKERIWCHYNNDCICQLDGSRHPSLST